MTTFVTREMRMFGEKLVHLKREANDRSYGKIVRILSGKYANRLARVEGADFDTSRGRWVFCCMVLRSDGSGEPLNSDGESRQYRTWEDFHEVEE